MAIPLLGETCALLSAACWAFALVFFKLSGASVPPLSLSLFKNVVGIILLGATMAVQFRVGAEVGDGSTSITDLATADLYILMLSGVVGIGLADTLLFYSLNLIGVGLLTIMECVYTPSIILFAWFFLHETVALHHYVGGALVLSAVLVSSSHAPAGDRTRGQLVGGMLLGVAAIVLMALGIVVAKPILEEAPLIAASLVRLVSGTVVLAIIMAMRRNRAVLFRVFRPSRVWRTVIPASVLSTYLAMVLWIAGYKYTQAPIAAILNQTSTIFALIFATLILKEPFTRRKLAAAALGLGGVAVVTTWTFWT